LGDKIGYDYSWIGARLNSEQIKELEITNRNQSILSMMVKKEFTGPINDARDWFNNGLAPIVTPNTRIKKYNYRNYLLNPDAGIDCKKFFIEQMQKADFQISNFRISEEERALSDKELKLNKELSRVFEENGLSFQYNDIIKDVRLLLKHQTETDSYEIDIEYESLGTQRYFEFIGLLCDLIFKDRVLTIDEIESSLHIDLIIHLIVTFLRNSKRGQLVFTSHNTALLNERDILRRDAIWITDRKPDGSTMLSSVSDFKIRKQHAIDRLYRKGLLGGAPNLGSTFLDGNYEKTEN
ncbi:MAG: AAA family ATPase, partial [Candidatus Cloacimonadaceae bacterium]|nr:AAA family ATPase [Candidatus Cloacimonadaceae bacterium]